MGSWNNMVILPYAQRSFGETLGLMGTQFLTNLALAKIQNNYAMDVARKQIEASQGAATSKRFFDQIASDKKQKQTQQLAGAKIESNERIASAKGANALAVAGVKSRMGGRSKTIYGPDGATKNVFIPAKSSYTPPAGWTLVPPTSSKPEPTSLKSQRELTVQRKIADAEEKIYANTKNPAVQSQFPIVNQPENTSIWFFKTSPGKIYGTNSEAVKVDIPQVNGIQYSVADIQQTAKEEFGAVNNKTIQQVLELMEKMGQYPRREGNKTYFPVIGQ